MSSAGDLTVLRQLIAQYSIQGANQNAWSTTQNITTSGTVAAANITTPGTVTATQGLLLPLTCVGTATLAAGGTVTVFSSLCTSGSYIFVTNYAALTSPGYLTVTKTTGSFTVASTNSSDRSSFQWLLINPA